MSRRNRINPLDLVPTEELSHRALDLLKAGEISDEFMTTAHHLTLSVGERQAVMEGTLLIVGAELEEIAHASSSPGGEPIAEHLRRDRRLFAYLQFTEGYFDADNTRRLRPIGREILDHCLILSTDTEVTSALRRIKDTGSPQ